MSRWTIEKECHVKTTVVKMGIGFVVRVLGPSGQLSRKSGNSIFLWIPIFRFCGIFSKSSCMVKTHFPRQQCLHVRQTIMEGLGLLKIRLWACICAQVMHLSLLHWALQNCECSSEFASRFHFTRKIRSWPCPYEDDGYLQANPCPNLLAWLSSSTSSKSTLLQYFVATSPKYPNNGSWYQLVNFQIISILPLYRIISHR